jgi:hypothetical protein
MQKPSTEKPPEQRVKMLKQKLPFANGGDESLNQFS